jgi:hypothetical protein
LTVRLTFALAALAAMIVVFVTAVLLTGAPG